MTSRGNKKYRRVLLVAAMSAGSLFPLLTEPRAAAQDQPATLPPLQVVVLVDESGSISEPDLVREKEAARTIASSTLAPGSIVSVVGFGSSEKPGQSAVDVVCQPTRLDVAQNRDSLAKCVGDLRKRAAGEGNGTDHVAALQQALAFVGAAKPEKKIVFLLTDGKLDVSNSPSWGDTAERRNGAASAKVQEVLTNLDKAGAQVWPLGFGAVDLAALRGFAKGKSCTPAAPDPREQVVPTSAELREAVQNAFSSASCVKYGPPATGSVPLGGSADLHVDIPAAASDASIVVYKRDSRIQVEYRAPNATKPAPAAGGEHFDFAGQTTETESLRITDPEPGQWTIHLSSAGVPTQDVAATVVYQAAVKAYLTASPPQPAPGETVDVNMTVWARGRAVTDPQILQGLTFVTTLTGSSGFPPQQVTLADPDGDGTFAGPIRIPGDASGDLTYSGQVTGIGVGGDIRTLSSKVRKGAAAIQAQILFDDNRATVTPGGTMSGNVSVVNNSGQPARLRLQIDDLSRGTSMTVDPAIVQASPGSVQAPFALRFGPNTPLGTSGATLRLVDDTNPATIVAERLFTTEIATEPGLLETLWWLWTLLGVLLAVGAAWLLLRLRSRLQAARVRGLVAQLWQGGTLASTLEPQDPHRMKFEFLVDKDFTGPQLRHAGSGEKENAFVVRRTSQGVTLAVPGKPLAHMAFEHSKDISGDLAIVVCDNRRSVGGVPTNPFKSSLADTQVNPRTTPLGSPAGVPSNPFAGSATATQQPPPQQPGLPQNGSASSRENESYADPNNPFG